MYVCVSIFCYISLCISKFVMKRHYDKFFTCFSKCIILLLVDFLHSSTILMDQWQDASPPASAFEVERRINHTYDTQSTRAVI